MQGQLFRVFLTNGIINGVMTIEIANRTMLGTICPKEILSSFLVRDESKKPGVYILVGRERITNITTLYIGQADEVGKRINQHLTDKHFWDKVIVFTAKDDYLTRTQITYLEARLIKSVSVSDFVVLDNRRKESLPYISEAEHAEAEEFLDGILKTLIIFGYDFFESDNETVISTMFNVLPNLRRKPKFDSIYEQKFAELLRHSDILDWLKPEHQQLKISLGEKYKYRPDFIVETDDAIYLIEVMGNFRTYSSNGIEKKQAANEYCDNINKTFDGQGKKQWTYKIVDGESISRSQSFEELITE